VRLAVDAAGGAQAGGARGRRSPARAAAELPATIELPLAAIEKARLVPQFDFKGKSRAARVQAEAASDRV
jgi:hypothetical protein